MAWNISDRFPLWGEDGEFPQDGFFYKSGDQVNEKHLDALWNGLQEQESEIQSALGDIDSDKDGVVDEADTANLYKNNDIDSDGDGKVDSAEVADFANNADTLDGAELTEVQIPSGVISMWSGSIASIPSGWTLCDGTDGAPDLTDRFITGAGGQYAVGDTGGEDEHTLTEAEMPSHTHTASADEGDSSTSDVFESGFNNNSTVETDATGGDQPHENRPPYHALAFIMKL